MANNPNAADNLKPFQKGDDPRRNVNGRPAVSTFKEFRELAQEIVNEKAKSGGKTIKVNGRTITIAEAILRQWLQSKNPALQMRAMEIAFGKVPDEVKVKSWQDEIVQLLKDGSIAPAEVKAAFPDLASQFFAAAGVKVDSA